ALLFIRPKPDRSGTPSQVSVTERGVPEMAMEEPHGKDDLMAQADKRAPTGPGWRRDDERAAASAGPLAGPLAMNDLPSTEGRAKGAAAPKGEAFPEAPPVARRAAPAAA